MWRGAMIVLMMMQNMVLTETSSNYPPALRRSKRTKCSGKETGHEWAVVCVKTAGGDNYGIKDEQGTDEKVWIRIFGFTCESDWFTLDTDGNDFEYDTLSCFDITVYKLGKLRGVELWKDHTYENSIWLVEYVAVQTAHHCTVFFYHSWLYKAKGVFREADPNQKCDQAGQSSSVTADTLLLGLSLLAILVLTSFPGQH